MFDDYFPVQDVKDSISFMGKVIGICSVVFPIAEQPIELEFVIFGICCLFGSLGFDSIRDWKVKRQMKLILNDRRTD